MAENINEWLRFSNMDLDSAKYLLENMHPAPLEVICYHCQQAAEKFIKAVIISFDIEIEKTHDLVRLINILRKSTEIPEIIVDSAEMLTQFATKSRYPQSFSVDERQTRNAILHAERIKIWAEQLISQK